MGNPFGMHKAILRCSVAFLELEVTSKQGRPGLEARYAADREPCSDALCSHGGVTSSGFRVTLGSCLSLHKQ